MFAASGALLEHFRHPRNAGRLEPGPGVVAGEAGSRAQGALVRFELAVDGARVRDARFLAWGCPATLACASVVAGWLPGKSLQDAYNVDIQHLVEELDLPRDRAYAPLVTEDALNAALEEVKRCPSA